MAFNVVLYELPDGREPVAEFLDLLPNKLLAKMYREIDLLMEFGPTLRLPHSRYLKNGIFEIRAQAGNDIARSLYFFVAGSTIVLTNGFVKKTQKTPESEIELALKYRTDYLTRHK